ncbi:unnamed protein product [Gongylonema pulchrum]|uniref:Uncharacterized protein n=1 Tax=Gongylonema pulchrum TaxID=637853 RepID=A0A183EVR4_9BILA|nr:unnamed protein product [Gongylonema pulchrum]
MPKKVHDAASQSLFGQNWDTVIVSVEAQKMRFIRSLLAQISSYPARGEWTVLCLMSPKSLPLPVPPSWGETPVRNS